MFRSRRRGRLGWSAIPLVTASLMVGLPAPAARAEPQTLSFWVVRPDGTPVAEPYVYVSVYGPTYPRVIELRGSADGLVRVPAPVQDPVAAQRIADKQPVNILIRVFDKAPGEPDLHSLYVTAALNVAGSIPNLPFDLARVGRSGSLDDKVYVLDADRGGWDLVDSGEALGSGDGAGWECTSDAPPPPPFDMLEGCYKRDYPKWALHNDVPIAENYGAGIEMQATLEYRSTHASRTSVAVQVGKSGFFEAKGGVVFEHETSDIFGWQPVGHGDNVRAVLDTAFLRERVRFCVRPIGPLPWRVACRTETTYRPDRAHGNGVEDRGLNIHDQYSGPQDCVMEVIGYYANGTGEERDMAFSLALGPGETWSTTVPEPSHGLHAQATVTAETATGKGFARHWEVDLSPPHRYHFLYVPGGMNNFDPDKRLGGHCPAVDIQNAWTVAANRDLRKPPAESGTSEPAKRAAAAKTKAEKCIQQHDVCG